MYCGKYIDFYLNVFYTRLIYELKVRCQAAISKIALNMNHFNYILVKENSYEIRLL